MDPLILSSNFQILQSLYQAFWNIPSAPIIISITVTFMFHNFLVLSQSLCTGLSFGFLWCFTLCSTEIAKSAIQQVLFFLLIITGSSLLTKISWSVCMKIPENFVYLILHSRFMFVYIPFGSMVKFRFLAQLPVDHLPYPLMSCVINFLS